MDIWGRKDENERENSRKEDVICLHLGIGRWVMVYEGREGKYKPKKNKTKRKNKEKRSLNSSRTNNKLLFMHKLIFSFLIKNFC